MKQPESDKNNQQRCKDCGRIVGCDYRGRKHKCRCNQVKNSYPNGICPDCSLDIPGNATEGSECINCGNVFWNERPHD